MVLEWELKKIKTKISKSRKSLGKLRLSLFFYKKENKTMELKIEKKTGRLIIDDARIIFRNFEGRGGDYNREGDRNFQLIIPDKEMADVLVSNGWNVKIKPGVNPDDDPRMSLRVKVKFTEYGPDIYLVSGKNRRNLSEDEVYSLDRMTIKRVDMDIRPYDWTVNGKTGRTAYLDRLWVEQNIDRFAQRFAEEEAPDDEDELPFK